MTITRMVLVLALLLCLFSLRFCEPRTLTLTLELKRAEKVDARVIAVRIFPSLLVAALPHEGGIKDGSEHSGQE